MSTTADTYSNLIKKPLSITDFFNLLKILSTGVKKITITYTDESENELGVNYHEILSIDKKHLRLIGRI